MYATYPTDYQFHQKYMMSKIDSIVYSLHSILFGAKLQQNSLTTRIIILFFTKKKKSILPYRLLRDENRKPQNSMPYMQGCSYTTPTGMTQEARPEKRAEALCPKQRVAAPWVQNAATVNARRRCKSIMSA